MKTISKQELKDKLAQTEKELAYLADSFKIFVSRNDKIISDMAERVQKIEPLELSIVAYKAMTDEQEKEIDFLKENVDREKLYQAQYKLFKGEDDES